MTEVVQQSSPSHFPSPSSPASSSTPCFPNNYSDSNTTTTPSSIDNIVQERAEDQEDTCEGDQLSLLALLVAAFRKSLVGCSIGKELCSMEIGLPTNVRHVAHVTFDRFNGFLGLPVEFEPEVPRRSPSASANVFGVSTESMQLSFDARGNSVPTILLLMQRHLYAQGGLQAEGIFRINAENGQEEYVRDQLNRGTVPDGIDVHCLAGLIKAWFRELPTGVLDSLSPEQVMQSQSEEECAQLVRLLPPTEAALLDWAVNLMADVAEFEHLNKMNARNVAMVFAPNMTQMSDPLTALMYAVQVMNFLKTLVIKILKEREDTMVESVPGSHLEPSDENGDQSSSQPYTEEIKDGVSKEKEEENVFVAVELKSLPHPTQLNSDGSQNFLTSIENFPTGNRSLVDNCPCEVVSQVNSLTNGFQRDNLAGLSGGVQTSTCMNTNGQSSSSSLRKNSKTLNGWSTLPASGPLEKGKGAGIVGRINSRTELFEAWR